MNQGLTKNVNLNVRMPPDIHRAVKQRAVRSRRSLNGEIIHRLEQSLMAEEAGDRCVTTSTPRPPSAERAPTPAGRRRAERASAALLTGTAEVNDQ